MVNGTALTFRKAYSAVLPSIGRTASFTSITPFGKLNTRRLLRSVLAVRSCERFPLSRAFRMGRWRSIQTITSLIVLGFTGKLFVYDSRNGRLLHRAPAFGCVVTSGHDRTFYGLSCLGELAAYDPRSYKVVAERIYGQGKSFLERKPNPSHRLRWIRRGRRIWQIRGTTRFPCTAQDNGHHSASMVAYRSSICSSIRTATCTRW